MTKGTGFLPEIIENDQKPLRLHELNVYNFSLYLNQSKVRASNGKTLMPLHDKQLEIVEYPARYKVVSAGRRVGKSLLCSIVALSALMQPNRKVWIIGPTYGHSEKIFREIYNILVNQLKLVIPGKKGKARNQKGDYFIQTPWNSVVEAKSMDNPDSLAGDNVDLVIVDEAALQMNLIDIWEQMLKPVLMDNKGSAFLISSPRGKNSFYKLYLNGQLGMKELNKKEEDRNEALVDWASFKATSYDNPYLGLSPEDSKKEIDNNRKIALLNGKLAKFNQEYLADFDANQDTVFPEFIIEKDDHNEYPNVIQYNWHPDEGPIFAACDFNVARPASTIFAQMNQYQDIIIFKEQFTPYTNTFMQAQNIIECRNELQYIANKVWDEENRQPNQRWLIDFEDVIADVSGMQVQLSGRTAFDEMEEVLGRPPLGTKQSRSSGVNLVKLWLKYPKMDKFGNPEMDEFGQPKFFPKLFIDQSCVNLIKALSSAEFKKGRNGILKDDYQEFVDGEEGLLDALRYLLVHLLHKQQSSYFNIIQGF